MSKRSFSEGYKQYTTRREERQQQETTQKQGQVMPPTVGIQEAVWSAQFINDLPDGAFLYISPGGTKDSEGKTTPRSLRHFPYKDSAGNVDLPHLRNALARIPQANIPAAAKATARAKAERLLTSERKKRGMT